MLRVHGSLNNITLATDENKLQEFRAAADKMLAKDGGAPKLELEFSKRYLYGRSIFLGYDLPNGNGDGIPSFFAGSFGPSFIGKRLDYEHLEDEENRIGEIMATWHISAAMPTVVGPRIIGKNVFGHDTAGRQIFRMAANKDRIVNKILVEGIWRLDMFKTMGSIVAGRLRSGELKAVSQEAQTGYCLCPICAHKIQFHYDAPCEHLRRGNIMAKSYRVSGYEDEILAFKMHQDPVGDGLGIVKVPAFDEAQISEITASLKSGQMTLDAAMELIRRYEDMLGIEADRNRISAAAHDFELAAADGVRGAQPLVIDLPPAKKDGSEESPIPAPLPMVNVPKQPGPIMQADKVNAAVDAGPVSKEDHEAGLACTNCDHRFEENEEAYHVTAKGTPAGFVSYCPACWNNEIPVNKKAGMVNARAEHGYLETYDEDVEIISGPEVASEFETEAPEAYRAFITDAENLNHGANKPGTDVYLCQDSTGTKMLCPVEDMLIEAKASKITAKRKVKAMPNPEAGSEAKYPDGETVQVGDIVAWMGKHPRSGEEMEFEGKVKSIRPGENGALTIDGVKGFGFTETIFPEDVISHRHPVVEASLFAAIAATMPIKMSVLAGGPSAETSDAIQDLAIKLQKKNPDLAWDDAQDQAYKQLYRVDQDGKEVAPGDVEKGKKMAKERKAAADAFRLRSAEQIHAAAVLEARLNCETASLARHAVLAAAFGARFTDARRGPTAARIRRLVAAQTRLDASKDAMVAAIGLKLAKGAPEGSVPAWCMMAALSPLDACQFGSPAFQAARREASAAMPAIQGFHARLSAASDPTAGNERLVAAGMAADSFQKFILATDDRRVQANLDADGKLSTVAAKVMTAKTKTFMAALQTLATWETKNFRRPMQVLAATAELTKGTYGFAAKRLRLPADVQTVILGTDDRQTIAAFAATVQEYLSKPERQATVILAGGSKNLEDRINCTMLLARGAFDFRGSLRPEVMAAVKGMAVKAKRVAAEIRVEAQNRSICAAWNRVFDINPFADPKQFASDVAAAAGVPQGIALKAGQRLRAEFGGMWPTGNHPQTDWPTFLAGKEDTDLEAMLADWGKRLEATIGTDAKNQIEANIRRVRSTLELRKQAQGCRATLVGAPVPADAYWLFRAADGKVLGRLSVASILGGKTFTDLQAKQVTSKAFGTKLEADARVLGAQRVCAGWDFLVKASLPSDQPQGVHKESTTAEQRRMAEENHRAHEEARRKSGWGKKPPVKDEKNEVQGAGENHEDLQVCSLCGEPAAGPRSQYCGPTECLNGGKPPVVAKPAVTDSTPSAMASLEAWKQRATASLDSGMIIADSTWEVETGGARFAAHLAPAIPALDIRDAWFFQGGVVFEDGEVRGANNAVLGTAVILKNGRVYADAIQTLHEAVGEVRKSQAELGKGAAALAQGSPRPAKDYMREGGRHAGDAARLTEIAQGEVAASSAFDTWIDTFCNEKGIDLEDTFEVEGPSGANIIPYGVIVEHMKIASPQEQVALKNMIVKLDFLNKPIEPYFQHLGQAIAASQVLAGKDLCEFGTCKKPARVQAVATNFKTGEKQSAKLCKDHLPSFIDECRRQERQVNFSSIAASRVVGDWDPDGTSNEEAAELMSVYTTAERKLNGPDRLPDPGKAAGNREAMVAAVKAFVGDRKYGEDVYKELETYNYHTLNEILKDIGAFKSSKYIGAKIDFHAGTTLTEDAASKTWNQLPTNFRRWLNTEMKTGQSEWESKKTDARVKLIKKRVRGIEAARMRYTGDIDKDFDATDVDIVAESVAEDLIYNTANSITHTHDPNAAPVERNEETEAKVAKLTEYLANRARTVYKNNADWGMKMARKESSRDGARDQLYVWLEHWAKSWLGNGGMTTEERRIEKFGNPAELQPASLKAGTEFKNGDHVMCGQNEYVVVTSAAGIPEDSIDVYPVEGDKSLSRRLKKSDVTLKVKAGMPDPEGIEQFGIYNGIDDMVADPRIFTTRSEAESALQAFKDRFKKQGFYRSNDGHKVPLEDLDGDGEGGGVFIVERSEDPAMFDADFGPEEDATDLVEARLIAAEPTPSKLESLRRAHYRAANPSESVSRRETSPADMERRQARVVKLQKAMQTEAERLKKDGAKVIGRSITDNLKMNEENEYVKRGRAGLIEREREQPSAHPDYIAINLACAARNEYLKDHPDDPNYDALMCLRSAVPGEHYNAVNLLKKLGIVASFIGAGKIVAMLEEGKEIARWVERDVEDSPRADGKEIPLPGGGEALDIHDTVEVTIRLAVSINSQGLPYFQTHRREFIGGTSLSSAAGGSGDTDPQWVLDDAQDAFDSAVKRGAEVKIPFDRQAAYEWAVDTERKLMDKNKSGNKRSPQWASLRAGITQLPSGRWRDTNGNSYATRREAMGAERANYGESGEPEGAAGPEYPKRLPSGRWKDENGNSYATRGEAARAQKANFGAAMVTAGQAYLKASEEPTEAKVESGSDDVHCSKCGKDLEVGDSFWTIRGDTGMGGPGYPAYCSREHLDAALADGSEEMNYEEDHGDDEDGLDAALKPAKPATHRQASSPDGFPTRQPDPLLITDPKGVGTVTFDTSMGQTDIRAAGGK